MRLKAHIAAGDDSYQLSVLHHRHTGNTVLAGEADQFADAGTGLNRDWIFNHATFKSLHLQHLPCLLLNSHVLVNDANATLLCHGDSQSCFRHGIHRCRNQRHIQVDSPG